MRNGTKIFRCFFFFSRYKTLKIFSYVQLLLFSHPTYSLQRLGLIDFHWTLPRKFFFIPISWFSLQLFFLFRSLKISRWDLVSKEEQKMVVNRNLKNLFARFEGIDEMEENSCETVLLIHVRTWLVLKQTHLFNESHFFSSSPLVPSFFSLSLSFDFYSVFSVACHRRTNKPYSRGPTGYFARRWFFAFAHEEMFHFWFTRSKVKVIRWWLCRGG